MDIIPTNQVIFELISDKETDIVPSPLNTYAYSYPMYSFKIGDEIKYTRSLLGDEKNIVIIYSVSDVKHEIEEVDGICQQYVIVYLEVVKMVETNDNTA